MQSFERVDSRWVQPVRDTGPTGEQTYVTPDGQPIPVFANGDQVHVRWPNGATTHEPVVQCEVIAKVDADGRVEVVSSFLPSVVIVYRGVALTVFLDMVEIDLAQR